VQSVLAFVIYILVLLGLIGFGYALYRRKAGIFGDTEPDQVTADVVSGLLAELRKAQAETAYWKTAAERLQREADKR
jgi:hypothetical protein